MDITKDVVELVARKLLRSAGPDGTNLEALQGCLLKLGEHRRDILISVEFSMDWLTNQKPPLAAYWAFISGHLIIG